MNRQITGLSTEALLSQIEFEKLDSPAIASAPVKRLLKRLALVPATAYASKVALEAIETISPAATEGISEVLSAVLIDLKHHEAKFEDCFAKLKKFTDWAQCDRGSRAVRQSAGAVSRTADPRKVERIARLLLNGALLSDGTENDEFRIIQLAEFTRIAEILTDTDVLVLRAIYSSQKALIEKYRELEPEREQSEERQLQDEWMQAVFQQWKATVFSSIRFIDVLSALPRLEAQGLIGRTTIQVVSADIASPPFGLLDLGALFVEQTLAYDGRLDGDPERR
jgi:hypothetical protein